MMNTLSLFPRKTAQPPLVGKTARTCTSITVLFIRETVSDRLRKTSRRGRSVAATHLTRGFFRSDAILHVRNLLIEFAALRALHCATMK